MVNFLSLFLAAERETEEKRRKRGETSESTKKAEWTKEESWENHEKSLLNFNWKVPKKQEELLCEIFLLKEAVFCCICWILENAFPNQGASGEIKLTILGSIPVCNAYDWLKE